MRRSKLALSTIGLSVAVCFSAAPAAAQTEELAEIDAMVDGAATPKGALGAARQQARSGDVSGAATTLERALIGDPDNLPVRVTYISYLCQLDDRQAAQFEVGKLAGQQVADAAWKTIEASCGPIPRPAQRTEG